MRILEKLYRSNFREVLREDDKVLFDLAQTIRLKEEKVDLLIARMNEGKPAKQIIRDCGKLLAKELDLLEGLERIDLKRTIIYKIIDNLKGHHDRIDRGVIYDTSNLNFIGHYRGEEALRVANSLLKKEVKGLPRQLDEFFSYPESYRAILRQRFFVIEKLKECFSRLKANSARQLDTLSAQEPRTAHVVETKLEARACYNLLDYYLISTIRKVILRAKLFNAENRLRPRRSVFFVFGGMERRYLPLINEISRRLRREYCPPLRRNSNFLYFSSLEGLDLYFVLCIGSSSRYYPPYYYIPSANDVVKFIKDNFDDTQVQKVLLFGVCGSFSDPQGTVYLPNRFSRLFYTFEKKVTVKDIHRIRSNFVTAENFLDEVVDGKRGVKVFTCSTLFNHSIVHVPWSVYHRFKTTVEEDPAIPNRRKRSAVKGLLDRYKRRKIETFSRYIQSNGIAHGVEMESYIFARSFPDRLGVYLEVSDNVVSSEEISFDMKAFHENAGRQILQILERILLRP